MKNGAGTGGHDGNSGALGRDDACEHARAREQHRGAQVLAEHERGPQHGEQGLGELHLAHARDAAAGEARVPREEAEEHGERGDVGEARPRLRGRGQVGEPDGGNRYHDSERQR